ncbi:MAG TPA: DUF4173 domain-containing protein [Aliidongia sp.]|uniref:DUF4153 domain-containing protein n=1 Tax=Aliidongia sp. TaxID=1914230 RepID=UPI002DDD4C79|nr:DUF4173 domain-containing protein [Aliidongia sp.]HEV2676157.1 DUF4173 domain-containing protein [Aliidongia sp.]
MTVYDEAFRRNRFGAGALSRRALICTGMVAAADDLLFRQPIGLSLPAFALLVATGAMLAAGARGNRKHMLAAALVLIAALLPMVNGVRPLAVGFGLAGSILFSLTVAGRFAPSARPTADDFLWFGLTGCSWIILDSIAVVTWLRRRPRAGSRGAFLLSWIVPVLLFGTFLWLLSSANPLIEDWLAQFDLPALLTDIDFPRVLFWCCILVVVWPFVGPRIRPRVDPAAIPFPLPPPIVDAPWKALVFGAPAILRSLVLFNALFAVQSVLDVTYLWNGAVLPDHLGYAAYAHRGAYPLVVTALLAGAFLIAATREGGQAARSRTIRVLIHVWTAQNLLLVASSILRLDLYVAAYSLTYLRFAAFIWMLLTGTGLVLILVRMSFDRSNAWLITSNVAALVCVLYVSSFIDLPRVISGYNVRHSLEMSENGSHLDVDYLQSLGPHALPALDDYILHGRWTLPLAVWNACSIRRTLSASLAGEPAGWRGWSLNGWRLDRHLSDKDAAEAEAECLRIL